MQLRVLQLYENKLFKSSELQSSKQQQNAFFQIFIHFFASLNKGVMRVEISVGQFC